MWAAASRAPTTTKLAGAPSRCATAPGVVAAVPPACRCSSSSRHQPNAAAPQVARRQPALRQQCSSSSSSSSSHLVVAAGGADAAAPQAAASSSYDAASVSELKQHLQQALTGLDRGIFGVPAAKRQEVAAIVSALEARNPLQQPTAHLERVEGTWDLLYTTISITGVRKTKLGLREFVKLGAFQQIINTRDSLALNVVSFRVAGFGLFQGNLTVKASYAVESPQRVSISFIESTLVPDKLQQLFEKNYALLLSIFNPEGWLDITYVDDELRVGRDDKGNLFVLQRAAAAAAGS